MRNLGSPDLSSDPEARSYIKDEQVLVEFAAQSGSLESAVGLNHYEINDALIQGSTGDRWCVSRDRFDAKYLPCDGIAAGMPGTYRNRPIPILAKQIHESFSVARVAGGDLLKGLPGDWLVEYGPGDYGLVDRVRFERVYRPL
jgi:hypothetical protein